LSTRWLFALSAAAALVTLVTVVTPPAASALPTAPAASPVTPPDTTTLAPVPPDFPLPDFPPPGVRAPDVPEPEVPEVPPAPDVPPRAEVTLTIALPDGRVTGDATLTCVPDGGTHPHAADACSELADAHGRFEDLRSTPHRFCPMIYAPVTARAVGMWGGEVVDYRHTYPNRCQLEVASGEVFELSPSAAPPG